MHADDTALVVKTRVHLQYIVNEFQRFCNRKGLKINVGKSKALMVNTDQRFGCEKVGVSGEEMEEVDKFNYMGANINKYGWW